MLLPADDSTRTLAHYSIEDKMKIRQINEVPEGDFLNIVYHNLKKGTITLFIRTVRESSKIKLNIKT